MILVTGSSGLIGRGIVRLLRSEGHAVREFDLRLASTQDTRDPIAIRKALEGVSGVIHLAAISRVVWAQQNPLLSKQVNVEALNGLLAMCLEMPHRPWVIFASSREVYGEQKVLPVQEDAVFQPANHYARGKVEGERLIGRAREAGLRTAICRFSNVFGCPQDDHDRVVTAFARTAAFGGQLRVDGSQNSFDFTYRDDVIDALGRMVQAIIAEEVLPPIHFVTGRSTTLGELASLAMQLARYPITVEEAPSRTFDVGYFRGDPQRAMKLLGWRSKTTLEQGVERLVSEIAKAEIASSDQGWIADMAAIDEARNLPFRT